MRHRVNPGATPVSGSGLYSLVDFHPRIGTSQPVLRPSASRQQSHRRLRLPKCRLGSAWLDSRRCQVSFSRTLSKHVWPRTGNGGSNLVASPDRIFRRPGRFRKREPDSMTKGRASMPRAARAWPKGLALRPEIGRDYPLNLSISLRGGKETNEDSLSNGE